MQINFDLLKIEWWKVWFPTFHISCNYWPDPVLVWQLNCNPCAQMCVSRYILNNFQKAVLKVNISGNHLYYSGSPKCSPSFWQIPKWLWDGVDFLTTFHKNGNIVYWNVTVLLFVNCYSCSFCYNGPYTRNKRTVALR